MAKSCRPAKTVNDKSTVRNTRISSPAELDASGPSDILAEKAGTQDVAFEAIAKHRHFARETDPDTYDAEKQLTKALPKLAKASSNPKLGQAFESHLQETQAQIARLEQVFESLDEKVRGKHCEGIAGIIEEGESIMAAKLLQQTLDEEKAADKKLSGLAEGGVNQSAADAAHSEGDEEPVGAAGGGRKASARGGRR